MEGEPFCAHDNQGAMISPSASSKPNEADHVNASPLCIDVESQEAIVKQKPLAKIRYIWFNTYRRIFTLAFFGNVIAFAIIMARHRRLLDFINACAANVLACGLARHPLVVNWLFSTFCAIPRSAPMRLRHLACKIFHLGGVHSGCGVASCLWYIGFVAVYTCQYTSSPVNDAVLGLTYLILCLFIAVIGVAHPTFRTKQHNTFEFTHRFSGWAILVVFWALLLTFASQQQPSMRDFLVSFPAFWLLLAATLAIIHPWLMLRRVPVTAEPLSSHATRLHFKHRHVEFGQGFHLSKHPLRDWHGFATIPDAYDNKLTKFSCLVSRAGDWTTSVITEPPSHLWVRGVPTFGFVYVMRCFSRIITVTTGSGIGPCLSFIEDEKRPAMRVLWQTKAPIKTYGQRIMDLVYMLDPDPVVMDTSVVGRVDMLPAVVKLFREFDAEAVCIISNPPFTRKLVFELESRGIPAYGPIFDS